MGMRERMWDRMSDVDSQERVLLVVVSRKAPGAKRPWQSAQSLGDFGAHILRTPWSRKGLRESPMIKLQTKPSPVLLPILPVCF